MIIGIGADLTEVEKVLKAGEKETFLRRIYTDSEREIFNKRKRSMAGNFAVKEAVVKMLGCGFRGINPYDIEVLRDELGKPYVNLYNNALIKSEELGIKKIHVSITDTREYAQAFVVGED